MAKRDREGLYDPKHYWARRVKAKYRYRGGKSQYPEKVGDWGTDETWYDGNVHGNRVYETESATFDHPSGGNASIYHSSGPKGETWKVASVSSRSPDRPYDSLKDALAALKRQSGEPYPSRGRRAALGPVKEAGSRQRMSAKQLCAIGDKKCIAELKRRGRDPKTGKKRR
jgi:hypothetical protein